MRQQFSTFVLMAPVLVSTFMFIPQGESEVLKIRFFLSDHKGLWNIDTNDVYIDQQLWNQWKDCKNNQSLQRAFFDGLSKISNALLMK